MKSRFVLLGIFLAVSAFSSLPGRAEDEIALDPEENARRSHELASSDVIYEQENYKALYYQNQEIIQLLKEIREELHNLNMRQVKEAQK